MLDSRQASAVPLATALDATSESTSESMVHGVLALFRDQPVPGRPWASDKAQSNWVMMARSPEDLGLLKRDSRWTAPRIVAGANLWTDDVSNVFEVMNVGLF